MICVRGAAAGQLTAELMGGAPLNFDSAVTIEQAGYPNLEFNTGWETHPIEQPFYWALRANLVRNDGTRSWSLELMHHKLYMKDRPPEVSNFSITHGYNIVTLQHQWRHPKWYWSALGGIVIAHPENTVRGKMWPETGGLLNNGWFVSGPIIGAGIGTRPTLVGMLYLVAEARGTISHANVDVVDGNARFFTTTLHLLIGLGVRP